MPVHGRVCRHVYGHICRRARRRVCTRARGCVYEHVCKAVGLLDKAPPPPLGHTGMGRECCVVCVRVRARVLLEGG